MGSGGVMGGAAPVGNQLPNLLSRLREGDFETLIGEAESAEVECKMTAYMLATDVGQLELAKDVAAFANSRGGLILLGFETESVLAQATDVVRKVRTFGPERFSAQQYLAVIESNIYPRIEGIACQWHPDRNDASLGVASLLIPNQSDLHKPFLVTRVAMESGRIRGNLLGWYQRHHDKVDRMDAKDIHHFIRSGRINHELERRLSSIETLLGDAVSTPITRSTGHDYLADEAESRVEDAIRVAKLSNRPAYVLTAWPIAPVQIPQLFASRSSKVVALLESPPTLRSGGFEIDAGSASDIVEGRLRRASYPEANRDLELWRDGSLLFAAPGDQDFLCWGRRQPPPLVINPVVLLESLYLFCELAGSIQQEMIPQNCGMIVGVEFHGVADLPLHLSGGVMGSFGSRIFIAPDARHRVEEQWVSGKINAAILAYRLATRVYEWFGLAHDRIPYVTGDGDATRIDTDAIVKLRG